MNTFSKRLAGFLGLGVVTTAVVASIAYAAVTWGPDRPTFTWAKPATYVTFNSITDNPVWGDERYIVKARDANASTSTYSTKVNVTDNEELVVSVYFHNNAASNLNLVSQNTKVKVNMPTGPAASQELKAFISADNATPQTVFSTMDFVGSKAFKLNYVAGSAKLKTNFVDTSISDDLVNGGTLVGTYHPNGEVKGCGEFSGYATFRVKVEVEQPQIQFACTGMDVDKVSRTQFDFTAHGSATNATIQSYGFTATLNGKVVDTSSVSTSATSAIYHFNQSTPGTYTVSSVVNTDHGSTTPSETCTKQVTVESESTTPPATPPAPLPNTGAGSTLAIFAGVSSLAGIGHYIWNVRRARI